jgi:hypothetical protein
MKPTLAIILCSALTALAQPTATNTVANIHFIKAKYGGWVTFTARPNVEYQVWRTTSLTKPIQWTPVNDYLIQLVLSASP